MEWLYAHLGGEVSLALKNDNLPQALRQLIPGSGALKSPEPDLAVTLCRGRRDLSGDEAAHFSGRYKGIGWSAALKQTDGRDQVFFYAPFFKTFLLSRIVLIPYLKSKIQSRGGFSFIGTAFSYGGTRFILFSPPGHGKTRLLFEALSQGARFLGDSEIIVNKEGRLHTLFGAMEFRLRSIHRSPYMQRLTGGEKAFLWLNYALSLITFKKICFNLCVPFEKLQIKPEPNSGNDKTVFILMKQDAPSGDGKTEDVLNTFRHYETAYRQAYGNLFQYDLKTAENALKEFLLGKKIYQVPQRCSFAAIRMLA